MGLFGRSDTLAAMLKRIETDAKLTPAEVAPLLELVGASPDLQIGENLWMLGHAIPKVRELGAAQCAARPSPELAEALAREMPGKPAAVRSEMAKLAVSMGAERIAVHLGPLVHSARPEQREAALDLIGHHPRWQDFLGHLKAAIKDSPPPVRQRAVRILTRGLENPTIFFILRELIHDEDPGVRRIVIQAFSDKPSPELVEPFFERIPLEEPQDRDLMIRALSHLARTCQSQVEEKLLPMLGDEKAEMRDVAVKLLREMPDRTRVLRTFLLHCRGIAFWLRERSVQSIVTISDQIVDSLLELMRDPDDDVRVGAMMLASGTKDPRVVPLAKEIFLGDADWWIRSMAADVLGNFADEAVVETLISRIEHPELQYSVIHVLVKNESPAAQKALRGCLERGAAGVRRAALAALARRKAPDVLQVLSKTALDDPDQGVRERASELLEGFGQESQGVLEEIESRRREAARRAKEAPLELEMANAALNARG
ncbi:MAG: HEAT repeat domain-containing protein [Planctomycetes bacterium]|nr:HEAT repeat domain-containing protein [Planctomycetota bacterium]